MVCEILKKPAIRGLAAALILLGGTTTASAISVISIDLDPTTAGIQSTLGVILGSSFTIDVVITGDGVMGFDTIAFDVAFNDLGAVLGLTGGTGSPTAGALAGTAPGLFPVTLPGEALDAFGGAAVAPGGSLTSDLFPLAAGFAGGIGGVGLLSPGPGFPIGGGPFPTIGSGATIPVFSLTLLAMGPGTSTVLPSTGGGLGGLAFFGGPVPFTTASGTVTVTSPSAVPVPAAIWLFGTGILGLIGFSKRRNQLTS